MRRGCGIGQGQFLPEESFESWKSYKYALLQTRTRLEDTVFGRSVDRKEITEIRARSGNDMMMTLNWWDLLWFGIGVVVGSGIFVLTGLEARNDAGPAVLLSYIISGLSAMLALLCYTEFAVEIPVAGGSFAYLRVELGDFVSYIAAGLTKADTSNYVPFVAHGARGVFRASAVVYFAYVGFDAVATMAEETKNPSRDIPIGLVGSMLIIIASYCFMAVTLCLMQYYTEIDPNAAYSVAFQKVGMSWAKYIVAFGALEGMSTALLGGIIAEARYLTHIARTHMLSPWFALVNEKTGTPINATAVLVMITSIIAFFTDLHILSSLVSISTLFVYTLVAVALLVRRYYVHGETSKRNQGLLAGFTWIILVSSLGIAIFWARSHGWIGYLIGVPIWFLSTLGLWWFVPKAQEPRLWGVPLVPWIPSVSIAVNIFLLGSIDKPSFIRFGSWTAIMLVYYLFFGLHASYDTAKAAEARKVQTAKFEEGNGFYEGAHNFPTIETKT